MAEGGVDNVVGEGAAVVRNVYWAANSTPSSAFPSTPVTVTLMKLNFTVTNLARSIANSDKIALLESSMETAKSQLNSAPAKWGALLAELDGVAAQIEETQRAIATLIAQQIEQQQQQQQQKQQQQMQQQMQQEEQQMEVKRNDYEQGHQ